MMMIVILKHKHVRMKVPLVRHMLPNLGAFYVAVSFPVELCLIEHFYGGRVC